MPSGLIEKVSGLRVEAGFPLCICDELPEGEPSLTTVYVNRSGQPLTPEGKAILNDAFRLQLSVVECRLPDEEIRAKSADRLSREYWDRELAAHGLPVNLPRIVGSTPPPRRPLYSLSDSEWRRWMLRRITLFFRLPASDPRVRRLADYVCGNNGWSRWKRDPELASLFKTYTASIQLQRRMKMLTDWAIGRGMARRTRKPFLLRIGRRYVFQFPAPGKRASHAQLSNAPLLPDLGPFIVPGHHFDRRVLAAAIYLWREHLIRPKKYARLRLSQAAVAKYVGVTRRQLAAGISDARRLARHV